MDGGRLVVAPVKHGRQISLLVGVVQRSQGVVGSTGDTFRKSRPQRVGVQEGCQECGWAELRPDSDCTEGVVLDGDGQVVVVLPEDVQIVLGGLLGPLELEQGRVTGRLR